MDRPNILGTCPSKLGKKHPRIPAASARCDSSAGASCARQPEAVVAFIVLVDFFFIFFIIIIVVDIIFIVVMHSNLGRILVPARLDHGGPIHHGLRLALRRCSKKHH